MEAQLVDLLNFRRPETHYFLLFFNEQEKNKLGLHPDLIKALVPSIIKLFLYPNDLKPINFYRENENPMQNQIKR